MRFFTIIICLFCLSGCLRVSTGSKVGILVRISQDGIWCPTTEAELIRGGIVNGTGSTSGSSFHFTISNKDFKKIAMKALDEQKQIKINYHQEFFVAPWRSETDKFLDSIEIIK